MLPARSTEFTQHNRQVHLDNSERSHKINKNQNNNKNNNNSNNNNNSSNNTVNDNTVNSDDDKTTHQQQITGKRGPGMIFRIEHLLPTTAMAPAEGPMSSTSDFTTTTTSGSNSNSNTPNACSLQSHSRLTTTAATTTTTMMPTMSEMRPTTPTTASGPTATTQAMLQQSVRRMKSTRQLSANAGVFTTQFIPKNTVSEAIPTRALMSVSPGNTMQHQQQQQQHYCSLSQDVLCMTSEILRRIKLSEDIHSYNALFELHAGQRVRIRVVRDIAANDELVAWFGEELTMLMSIPFLAPLNIQGNKRYTCHLCHLTFETPNPLKVHLALGCGRHSMDILWIRLHYAVKASTYSQHLPLPTQSMIPMMITHAAPHRSPTHPSTSSIAAISPTHSPQPHPQSQSQSQPHSQPQPQRQPARLSAFKPISPSTTMHSGMPTASTAASTSHAPPSTLSFPSMHATTVAHSSALAFLPTGLSSALQLPSGMNILQPPSANPLNAAAQIEAIVSNMGASKQGHLCIYCGKVYSRKYGLKIHIRTHTGFKPLKCKFCLRPFGDPSNLNKHVRLHLQSGAAAAASSTGNAEGYKCHLCHKTLARRRDLQRHMESRHSNNTAAPHTHASDKSS